MKIIYLVSRAKISGPINQALNILSGLVQSGKVDATLVTINPEVKGNSWLDRFKEKGIRVFSLNQRGYKLVKSIILLRQYITQNKIDVIHVSGFRACFITLFVPKCTKRIVTQRCDPKDIAEKLPPFVQPICKYFYLFILRKMDVVVACSESLQHVLINQYQINALVVQNGVDTAFFRPLVKVDKSVLKQRLKLENKRIYLVLGSLRSRKNNILIIDAINKMNKFDGMLLFVGDGPEREFLEKQSKGNPQICFIGNTDSPVDYLQASDFLVSSALAEGLPNTVLEALSCGLVPILSDILPHLELVGGTAIEHLFDKNSSAELSELLCDSTNWDIETQSAYARQIAVERFGIRCLASKYERIYFQVGS